MQTGLSIIIALIIAAVGGGTIGTIVSALLSRKTKLAGIESTAQNQLIDDLRAQLRDVQERVGHLERVEKRKDNYISALRNHIYANLGPPPPAWPTDLTNH